MIPTEWHQQESAKEHAARLATCKAESIPEKGEPNTFDIIWYHLIIFDHSVSKWS